VRKKKKHPIKYLKFKGCFGSPLNWRKKRPEEIEFPEIFGVYNEVVFTKMTESFDDALNNPDKTLDMRQVKRISIDGGLLLKAFYEEYYIKHQKNPHIRGPKEPKMRAVFNHLGIGHYQDVKKIHFADVECWQILSWDHSDSNIHLGKFLSEEVFPKAWGGKHKLSEKSEVIATSVAEAFYNCAEHAYTGKKENSLFKRWYLGLGDYPNSNSFSFNIYDKGIGIKARLQANPDGWLDKASDWLKSDSEMIKLATKGKRGASEGRGEGLKFAVNEITKNSGEIAIYSEYGYFSSSDMHGVERTTRLEGTLVSFSFPIEYTEGNI